MENVAYQKEIGESLNTVRQLKEELTVLKDEEEKLKVNIYINIYIYIYFIIWRELEVLMGENVAI